MDPNNNQPIGSAPVQQSAAQQPPAPAQPVTPVQSPPSTPVSEAVSAPLSGASAPKKGMGKGVILLIILLLLVIGIAGYVLFAKSQNDKAQKAASNNTSSALPTPSPTASPTPLPENDLEVSTPEADLLDIEADVKGL